VCYNILWEHKAGDGASFFSFSRSFKTTAIEMEILSAQQRETRFLIDESRFHESRESSEKREEAARDVPLAHMDDH
jgi:hypothetical protein